MDTGDSQLSGVDLVRPLWKLQRHFSGRKTEGRSGQDLTQLVFAIDPPDASANSSTTVTIKGRCFAYGGPEIVGVRAKVGRKSYFARYGLTREEMKHGGEYPGAFHAGFSVTIPSSLDGPLRLEAISQGGCGNVFASLCSGRKPN